MHPSIDELGFGNPSLYWSYRLALKSEIVLELSNIPVVRDFPNIFSEVLPGCHLAAMLSSWPSWFSYKALLLQESVLDIPELVGWARQQLGELGDKSLSDLVHVKGYLLVCVCVCWRRMISSSTDPRDQLMDLSSCPTFDLGVGYPQIKSETNDVRNVVLLVAVPRAYTIISFGLTNTITLFT